MIHRAGDAHAEHAAEERESRIHGGPDAVRRPGDRRDADGEDCGITRGRDTGIERAEISRIERGEADLTTAPLGTLTRALGVDVRLVPAA